MRPGALLIKIGGAHRPLERNGAMPAKSPRGRGHLAGRNRASVQVPGQQILAVGGKGERGDVVLVLPFGVRSPHVGFG
jgi:hypothetical protein